MVVNAGDPSDSYLITIIEDGDMPKGRLTVSDKELDILRKWVEEGAHFDGEDKTEVLNKLASSPKGKPKTKTFR